MRYLLGIDGGGTHTTAWIADEDVSVLARAQSGPSNPIKAGIGTTQLELRRAYRRALRSVHIPASELAAFCVGLAGSDSAAIQRPILRWMRKEFPASVGQVTTDAVIALAAALGNEAGSIVIAGTGSIAFGRDSHGRVLRVGGWGSLYDDAGSGYDIGRRAITAALRAHDGRGKPTLLTESLCREFHFRKVTDLIAKPLTTQQIAAVFPLVQQRAAEGDAIARDLCKHAATELADLALTLIRQMGRQTHPARLFMSGGVLQSSPLIRRAFARCVHNTAPKARISLLRIEPVQGALLLARQMLCLKASKRNAI